jgi:hypothetical protein
LGCNPDICIICIWPDYPIEWGGGTRTGGSSASDQDHPTGSSGTDRQGDFYLPWLGHAGILLINGGTGPATAHYYEYGRYSVEGGNPASQGNVRDYPVTGIVLRDNGWPTEQSLHQAVWSITVRSGRTTHFHGNVDHKCGDCYEKAVDYAETFRTDPGQHYSISTNNCMTFSFRVNKAGGWRWFGPIPVWNSRPAGQVEEGLWHNYLKYDPDGDSFREYVWQI